MLLETRLNPTPADRSKPLTLGATADLDTVVDRNPATRSASAETAAIPPLPEIVEQIVHSRTGGKIRGLRVYLDGKRMIITGRTSTYYSKQLATHAALDAACVHMAIQNDVEVC